MKITKEKTWTMIQILFAVYLIISSCVAPGKPDASQSVFRINNKNLLTQNEPVLFKGAYKLIASAKAFFLNNP